MRHLTATYLDDAPPQVDPAQLVVQTFERVLAQIDAATEAWDSGQARAGDASVTQSVQLLSALLDALDPRVDPDLSATLAQLYSRASRCLLEARFERDLQGLEGARRILRPLRDAWREAAEHAV